MDFKFTTTKAEGTDKKEFLEKINQEKARNAEFKSKFKYALLLQKYMRGMAERKKL